jgi:hypothetical protein
LADTFAYSEIACVEQVGVNGTAQGGGASARVALVAGLNVGEDVIEMDVDAARSKFVKATSGADFWSGGNEQLRVGFGRDDGANVAAVKDCAAGLTGEGTLTLKECSPDGGMGGDDRSGAGSSFAANFGIGKHRVAEVASGKGIGFVRRIAAVTQDREADGAIEQAGVEMWQVEMGSKRASNRALARRRGAIDGNDHEVRDRSAVIRPKIAIIAHATSRITAARLKWTDREMSRRIAPIKLRILNNILFIDGEMLA